jgi:hypothetical protein
MGGVIEYLGELWDTLVYVHTSDEDSARLAFWLLFFPLYVWGVVGLMRDLWRIERDYADEFRAEQAQITRRLQANGAGTFINQ